MTSTLQRTALYSKHLDLKAKLVPFAGFEMPIQYTSIKDEVAAVRSHCGIFDVSHMGEFIVEGKDAIAFCDYLVTNDIANAPTGKAIYSPLCRDNGTIIDDLIIYKIAQERVLVCVNASNIDKDWAQFSKIAPQFKIKLTNQSSNYSLIAIQGPKAETQLQEVFGTDAKSIPTDYYSVSEFNWNGHPVIVARTGYTGEDGFEVFSNHSTIITLWDSLLKQGCVPCGLAARDVLRLEVAYPLYGNELNDEVTPLDAGLKWTVKLEKANFIGKNALVEYQPKYQLVKLTLDKQIPRSHYEVKNQAGTTIGEITSGTLSPTINKGIALARVEKKNIPADKQFYICIRGQNHLAVTFNEKTFVKGGHK